MITVLLVILTLVWSLLAFGLFVGADHLAARLRGREATFEWFDRTPWSGRSTPARRKLTRGLMGLTGAFVSVVAVGAALALLALALAPLVADPPPRPPAKAPSR